jgi:hypothetical protein
LLEQTSGAVAKAQARQAALVAQQQLLDDMEDADDEDNALSDQERQERIRRNQERLRQIKDYKDKEKAALDGKERLLFEAEERKREFKATLCKTTVQGMEKGGMQWVEEQLEDRGLDAVTGTTSDIGKEKGGGGGWWVVVVYYRTIDSSLSACVLFPAPLFAPLFAPCTFVHLFCPPFSDTVGPDVAPGGGGLEGEHGRVEGRAIRKGSEGSGGGTQRSGGGVETHKERSDAAKSDGRPAAARAGGGTNGRLGGGTTKVRLYPLLLYLERLD